MVESKNPLDNVYNRIVRDIKSRISSAELRGWKFRDISNILKKPQDVKPESIEKLKKKFSYGALYNYGTLTTEEGKKYKGERGYKYEVGKSRQKGWETRRINLKRMEFEREERERQEQFIRDHDMTDREKEIYLNEGEDAYYEFIHGFDFIDDVIDTVLDEPEKPEEPKIPNHTGGYDRLDHYDIDYNDAILMRVEEAIDGWTPRSWWFDSQIKTKSWRRCRVQMELYDAIDDLGREAVAKSCEQAGQTLLDKLEKVLYDSESERNQSEIDEAQDYCLSVFWNNAYTVTTAKTISRELEESWID